MSGEQGRNPAILASDRERERASEVLSTACAEGRLSLDEFSDRLQRALSARTTAELVELVADLGSAAGSSPPAPPRRPGRSWFVAVMSTYKRAGRWRLQPQAHAVAVMGDCRIDLSGAELSAAESHITVISVMGSVRILVPEGVDVDVDGLAIMGTKSWRGGEIAPPPGAPRIRITVVALMGDVSVRTEQVRDRLGSPPTPPGYAWRPRHARRQQRRLERLRDVFPEEEDD